MKRIYIFLIFFLTTGCSLDSSRIAPGYIEAFKSINDVLFGFEESPISADLIKNIPYASMTVKIGNGPRGLLILESKIFQENIWVSADAIYIKERNGKIIQTKGLNNNLQELEYTVDFADLKNVDTMRTYLYYKSFSNPTLKNLPLTARFSIKEKSLVKLINREIPLTLIEETITSKDLGWEFVNQYWIDDNSFVWKSSQRVSPRLPVIEFEITKKPS